MRIPGLKALRLSARWLRSRARNGALILGYHRIARKSSDPYSICVSPEHFAEQLAALRKYSCPIALGDLVQGLRTNTLPARAVAITFDDGYKDHLYLAKPLLEQYQIPATVFVTTGYLGTDFWWNVLEETLMSPPQLPTRLCFRINGRVFDWRSDPSIHPTTTAQREELVRLLHERMLCLPPREQRTVLQQLQEWTRQDAGDTKSTSALTPEELLRLAAGDLLEIGAHSVTHPCLDGLDLARQQFEVEESKSYLETLLRRPVSGFSYPNGAASEHTRSLVRQSGYGFACASYNDIAWGGSDCFYLPRFWIGDWDGQIFSRWLNRWLSRWQIAFPSWLTPRAVSKPRG